MHMHLAGCMHIAQCTHPGHRDVHILFYHFIVLSICDLSLSPYNRSMSHLPIAVSSILDSYRYNSILLQVISLVFTMAHHPCNPTAVVVASSCWQCRQLCSSTQSTSHSTSRRRHRHLNIYLYFINFDSIDIFIRLFGGDAVMRRWLLCWVCSTREYVDRNLTSSFASLQIWIALILSSDTHTDDRRRRCTSFIG